MPLGADFLTRMMGLGGFIDHKQQQEEARRAYDALYNSEAGLYSPFHPANRPQHGMLVPHVRAGQRVAPPWERVPIPHRRHLAPPEQALVPLSPRGPGHARRWPPQQPYPPGIYRRRRRIEPIEEWELEHDETDDDEFLDDDLSDSGDSFLTDDASFSDLDITPRLLMRETRGSFDRPRPVLERRRQHRQRYGDGARRRAHPRQVSRGLYGRGGGIDRVYGRYPRDRFRTGDYGGSAYESESSLFFADD